MRDVRNEKRMSDRERVENILKQFPSNPAGGNNARASSNDICDTYSQLMDFIESKRGASAARVHDAVSRWVTENHASLLALANVLGVDSTIIKRAGYTPERKWTTAKAEDPLEGKRLTWLPFDRAEKLCYLLAKMSCHELYLGFEGMTLLPRRYAALAELVHQSASPNVVREKIRKIVEQESKAGRRRGEQHSGKMSLELCRNRLEEICEDRYVPTASIIRNVPRFMKMRLNGLFTDAKAKPKTVTILSLALMIGTSVDYFAAVNYLDKTDAYYYAANGDKRIVDEADLRWLRILVALPDAEQERILPELYRIAMENR